MSSRDRDLASELTFGTIRRQETLDHLLSRHLRKPIGKAHGADRAALRLGAYQLVCLSRIPQPAAVHSTVQAVKAAGRPGSFVNAVLRKLAGEIDGRGLTGCEDRDPRQVVPLEGATATLFRVPVLPPPEDLTAHLAAAYSHPPWLVDRFRAEHGDDAALSILRAGVTRPPLSLRPAPQHADQLRAALTEAGHEVEDEGRCLLLRGAGRVTALPGFDERWFAVQDATAAEVVEALDPAPGAAILELCAAPGGKTVELAQRVGPGGAVLAVDLPGPRTEMLRREIARRELGNVAVLAADAADPDVLPRRAAGRSTNGFDAVLIDVPCSNTGVFARRVEARRRLEGPDRITMLAEQAAHLLLVGASRVAHGGKLAYATCSIDREENRAVVDTLLTEDRAFRLVLEKMVLPSAGRRSGGYVAILQRTNAQ